VRKRATLGRIKEVAQSLAGTSRAHGFAGIGLEATALEEAAADEITGREAPPRVEQALDRVMARIKTH
jgi:hypothetical protein